MKVPDTGEFVCYCVPGDKDRPPSKTKLQNPRVFLTDVVTVGLESCTQIIYI